MWACAKTGLEDVRVQHPRSSTSRTESKRLWPESEQEHARSALLSSLPRNLDANPISDPQPER